MRTKRAQAPKAAYGVLVTAILVAGCPGPSALVAPVPSAAPARTAVARAAPSPCDAALAKVHDALAEGLVARAARLLGSKDEGACAGEPARATALRAEIAARAGTLSFPEARAALSEPRADAEQRERALYQLERLGGAFAERVTVWSEPGAQPTRVGGYDVWPLVSGEKPASLVVLATAARSGWPGAADVSAVVSGRLASATELVTLDARPEGSTFRVFSADAGSLTTIAGAEIHVLDNGQVAVEDPAQSPTAKLVRLVDWRTGAELWRAPLASYYFADVAALGTRWLVARSRTDMFYGVAQGADEREAFGATVYERATGRTVLRAGGVLGVLPDGERWVVCEETTGHTLVVRPEVERPEYVLPTETCAGVVATSANGKLLLWGPVRQHDSPVRGLDLTTGRQWSLPVAGLLPTRWGSEMEASVAIQKGTVTDDWAFSADGRHWCARMHFFVSGGGEDAVGCPVAVGPGAALRPAPRRLARLAGVVRDLPAALAPYWDPATGVVELVPTRDGRHVAAVQRDTAAGELVLSILEPRSLRPERSVRVPLVGAAYETGRLRTASGPASYELGSGEGWVVVDADSGAASKPARASAPVPATHELALCLAGHLVLPDAACARR